MAERAIFFSEYTLLWHCKQILNSQLKCTYHLTSYVSYQTNFTTQFKEEFAPLDL